MLLVKNWRRIEEKGTMNNMYLSQFWRNWQEVRKLWWVQALYLIVLLGSYTFFAYVVSYIWLLETPSFLQLFLIAIGSFLGVTAILVSCLDCILLCCRRSARVQSIVVESIALQQNNPMLIPRKPLGRAQTATAEKARESIKPEPTITLEP